MKDLLFEYEMIGKRDELASEDYDNKSLCAEILYQMMEDDGIENPQRANALEDNLHKNRHFDWRSFFSLKTLFGKPIFDALVEYNHKKNIHCERAQACKRSYLLRIRNPILVERFSGS